MNFTVHHTGLQNAFKSNSNIGEGASYMKSSFQKIYLEPYYQHQGSDTIQATVHAQQLSPNTI